MKELKLRHVRTDEGTCTELWQSESTNGRRINLGRDTGAGHAWFYYSGGEPSHLVPDDVEIVVCDKKWKQLFRDGNDRKKYPDKLPSFRQQCKIEWEKIKHHYKNIVQEGFCDWIESFMPSDINNHDRINWRHNNRYQTDEITVLHKFFYLNEEYRIVRVKRKHAKCRATWYEYWAISKRLSKHSLFEVHFGYQFTIRKKKT